MKIERGEQKQGINIQENNSIGTKEFKPKYFNR